MAATPSLVSDSPSSVSPSKVAESPALFHTWKKAAKVVEIEIPPAEVTDRFDKLYELEVPSILVHGSFPTPVSHGEAEFQLAVRRWASTLPPVEGDEYGILPALPTLALAHNRIRNSSDNRSKEHTQRRGIDDIIEFSFSAKRDRHCKFKIEESYRLVASAGNPDAQCDTLVTIPSKTLADKISLVELSFEGDETISELYWSTGGLEDGFSIIGFPGEFKKDENDSNRNQLIMVLATAQAQRKALSLRRSIIMGAIASGGHVQIFSSYWSSDESIIYIYAHEQQFNLSNPIHVIHLFLFCSKLERDFQGTLALELETWNTPTETALQSRKWRSPDRSSRKRRRTEAGESGSGSNRGRGVGGIGPAEADGFDGDCYMDIMKWRDEVVKDGREGRLGFDVANILDAPAS